MPGMGCENPANTDYLLVLVFHARFLQVSQVPEPADVTVLPVPNLMPLRLDRPPLNESPGLRCSA